MKELSDLVSYLRMSKEGHELLLSAFEFLALHQDTSEKEYFWERMLKEEKKQDHVWEGSDPRD